MLRTMELKYGCLLRKEDISIKMMAFCCCFVCFLVDFSMWWAKSKKYVEHLLYDNIKWL